MTFKVGDKVKISVLSKNSDLIEFHDKIATITNQGCSDYCWDLEWADGSISHDWNQIYFMPDIQFQIGDEVEITIQGLGAHMKTAKIIAQGTSDKHYNIQYSHGLIQYDWHCMHFIKLSGVKPKYHIPPDTSKYSEEGKKILKKVKDIIHQAFEPVAKPQYFKVGDKVEAIKGPNRGMVGSIVSERYRGVIDNTMYMISNDSGVSGWYAAADEIELTSVRNGPQGQFKIGNRVAINLIRMPEWNGARGYIEKVINDHSYGVILDGNSTVIQFHSSQLDRLPNVVPQSDPQFAVGNKVQTIYGMGIISQANFSLDTDWMYRVVLDNGKSMTFAPMGLKSVEKPQFKIDDRIRIISGDHEDKYGHILSLDLKSEQVCVAVDEGFVGVWSFKELELVGKPRHFDVAAMLESNSQKRETCKLCNGTGERVMFNKPVPCDCILADTGTDA